MDFLIFSLLAALAVLSTLVSTYGITSYLEDRGIKISYWNLRSQFWGYLRQYKNMTIENTGLVGSYYYIFLASSSLSVLWLIGVVIFIFGRR